MVQFGKTESIDFVLFITLKEAVYLSVGNGTVEAGEGTVFGDLASGLEKARPGSAR